MTKPDFAKLASEVVADSTWPWNVPDVMRELWEQSEAIKQVEVASLVEALRSARALLADNAPLHALDAIEVALTPYKEQPDDH